MEDVAKTNAARRALRYIRDGMVVGLGSGSTAEIFIELLAERARAEGLRLTCVPTSERTAALARDGGLSVADFRFKGGIDIAVDGADQVDAGMNLIKGYGGAMLRERLVDCRARHFLVIVDEGKMRDFLGGRIPIEVAPKSARGVIDGLGEMGFDGEVRLRDGKPFITDNGNIIVDARIDRLALPAEVDSRIRALPGVMDTGIFTNCVWRVVVGNESGSRVLVPGAAGRKRGAAKSHKRYK